MPTIGWDESLPSDSENAGLGDDRIRSLKTSLRIGLDGEHVWPSGGGDVGIHRLGSARPFYDVQSLVSSTGTDGRLMVTSDTSRMFHIGSAGTMFLGGASVPSVGSAPVGGQRFYWAMEFGKEELSIGAKTVFVTIPNSGYSGLPFVQITGVDSGESRAFGVAQVSQSNFQVQTGLASGNLSHFFWLSLGTRTF